MISALLNLISTGMAASLEFLDRDLYRAINVGLHRDWLDKPMLLTTYSGDGWFQSACILAAILFKKSRTYGWACLASWATSGLIRLTIVKAVSRQRPSNFAWARPLEDVFGNSSFPSGHTTTSFAIAFMVAWLTYKTDKAWISWLLVAWASLVGFSRVYVGVHYPFDVLGGICLAAACSSAIYMIMSKKGWLPKESSIQD